MAEQSVHAKSSRTADGVALRRIFTDIPLCKEIYERFERINGRTKPEDLEREKFPSVIPFFEARYLLTDRLLAKSRIKQIFEHAAGLTPRSLLFGASNPDARCVEFDLTKKLGVKKKIVNMLVEDQIIAEPTNLWFESGNVTDMVALATASRHFRNEPIAIINEGLDRYLSLFERGLKLDHIHRLLKHFKGINITPDIATKTSMEAMRKMPGMQSNFTAREAALEKKLGFRMSEHYHKNTDDCRRFHEQHGFSVDVYCLDEVLDELSSPRILGLDITDVKEMLSKFHEFVLYPK
jgi:hypothetical protein